MPELPEVETVRRGLNCVSLDQLVQGGEVRLARTIAYPELADIFLQGVTGVWISGWYRRGKYLIAALEAPASKRTLGGTSEEGVLREGASEEKDLEKEVLEAKAFGEKAPEERVLQTQSSPATSLAIDLADSSTNLAATAGWLGVHLRMTGQLLWVSQREPVQKHCRVRLFFDNDRELRYVDQRTFGRLWWVPPAETIESVMTGLQRLGPEPFSDEFSVDYLVNALKGRQRPIKNALLDQKLVAGIGNIYADEALFLSGIRPAVLCDRLSKKRIASLHSAIREVLTTSIESGGTTFSDFRDVHGTNGNYGGVAWVYDREGEPCRNCGGDIVRLKLAGRSAHYCLRCQR